MILQARDPAVVKHQSAAKQQVRFCNVHLRIAAAQLPRHFVAFATRRRSDVETQLPRHSIVPLEGRMLIEAGGLAQKTASSGAHERKRNVPKRRRNGELRWTGFVVMGRIAVGQLLPRAKKNRDNSLIGPIAKTRNIPGIKSRAFKLAPIAVHLALTPDNLDAAILGVQRVVGIDNIKQLSVR